MRFVTVVLNKALAWSKARIAFFRYLLSTLPKRYAASAVTPWLRTKVNAKGIQLVRRVRAKPHILILRNSWYSAARRDVSTEQMHLDETLRATDLATFDVLTYDHDLRLSPLSDIQFVKACRRKHPDAILLSSWTDAPRHPSVDALRLVREAMGIPVAAIWRDTCSQRFWEKHRPHIEQFDVNLVVDNPCLHHVRMDDPMIKRLLPLWVPMNTNAKPSPIAKRNVPLFHSWGRFQSTGRTEGRQWNTWQPKEWWGIS